MLRWEVALHFIDTQPSTIYHVCVTDVLWVALYFTVTHSAYRTSFSIESTSVQLGIVYNFCSSLSFLTDVFVDVSLVS